MAGVEDRPITGSGIVHIKPQAAGGAGPGGGGGTTEVDGNGPILTHPKLFLIFWGSAWSGAAVPSAADVTNAVSKVVSGNYLMLLGEYHGIGDGTLIGAVLSIGSSPPNSFSNANVASQVTAVINSGVAPAPPANSQILYAVVMPKGVNSNQSNIIGEHFTFSYTPPGGSARSSPIAWVTNDGTLDSVMTVFTHELAEAATDPAGGSVQFNAPGICTANPNSWCEVGDLCNGQRAMMDGVTVQKELSQAAGVCEVTPGSGIYPLVPQVPGNVLCGKPREPLSGRRRARERGQRRFILWSTTAARHSGNITAAGPTSVRVCSSAMQPGERLSGGRRA